MDILIKNLKIPKEKYIRVEIHHDGTMYVQRNGSYSFYTKLENKAIELPPHGRLIDADALCNKLKSPDFAYFSVAKFESIIDEAETIVEATE